MAVTLVAVDGPGVLGVLNEMADRMPLLGTVKTTLNERSETI
jgi:selenophosphate synthase